MIWQHLTAFLWLRWRLLYNAWRRTGKLNAVLTMIAVGAAVVLAVPLFFGCLALCLYVLPKARPAHLMYAWDALVAAFLLVWCIGLLIDLQRTEPLSLSRFLHLPVSPNAAFLINYANSLLSLCLVLFGPPMLGFAVALVISRGVTMLPVLPLLLAFWLMVSAVTYQFQGWLGSLMTDPRRRRTVVVMFTMVFILVCQFPNAINFVAMSGMKRRAERNQAMMREELAQVTRAQQARQIDPEEAQRRSHEITDRYAKRSREAFTEVGRQIEQVARWANLVLPVGWLPLGVMTADEGHFVPPLLGIAGMTAIGVVSLRRAYRATIDQYRGQSTRRTPRAARAGAAAGGASAALAAAPARLVEARLPGMSEPVSAVALAGFQSLLRAPEAKMMLLSPLLTALFFGFMIWNSRQSLPEPVRPMIALGAMAFVLMGMVQLMGNQFGFDRDGFRVFVLSAASRRDILAGKNLAFAPAALGIGLAELVGIQVLCPLRLDHLLAMPPLFLSMFLLFALTANVMSILTPLYYAPGAAKPASPKLTTGLLQLLIFTTLFPLSQTPVLLPLGVEAGLSYWGHTAFLPVGLLIALAECAVVVFVYRVVVRLQGDWLQMREQAILDVVTHRAA